ncbi:MAG: carboxypeptidase-like regulatory domain-containing protein, partial [Flavobacteriales bacterium]
MKSLITILLCTFSLQIMAQESFSISGSVIDEKNKAFDLAFVSLSNALDSTVVKSDYTDLDGSFKLNNVPSGNYFLQVSMLSFNTYTSELELNENLSLEPIVLSASTMDLDVATVETKVPFVERKIDRIVVNPEALGSTAGNNAIDIIEKAPGLSVNPDGTIQLKGRSGVAVYINEKPSYLSGTELESYLRSLPAGSIKKIEIMENPPAKYDAAGSAGIINIILDRNTLRGFYGNLSISARQGKMSSSNNSLNLNYNRKKI